MNESENALILSKLHSQEKIIAEQQVEIEKLKGKLTNERIEFVNVMNERDALRKYKEILDIALAATEKIKEKE